MTNLNEATSFVCKCGNDTFLFVVRLWHEGIEPIWEKQILKCDKCGTLYDAYKSEIFK